MKLFVKHFFVFMVLMLTAYGIDYGEMSFKKDLRATKLTNGFKCVDVSPDVAIASLLKILNEVNPELIRESILLHKLQEGGIKNAKKKWPKISLDYTVGVDAWTVFEQIMISSLWHWSNKDRELRIYTWHQGQNE
jgi:hypothetical protein